MRPKKIAIKILIALILLNSYANAESISGNTFDSQDTIKAVELFNKNAPFVSSSKNNYVFKRSQAINVQLKEESDVSEINVNVYKWSNNSWQIIGIRKAHADKHKLQLKNKITQPGLYKLEFQTTTPHKYYVLISDNWKKPVFTFCRKTKGYLELNTDPKLIRSTIAISHFNNVMEITAESKNLSPQIFTALKNAIKAKHDFENGKTPDFVIPGMTKIRLKRFYASDVSEFIAYIPPNYSPSQKHPMAIRVDPYSKLHNYKTDQTGMIDLWWHFGLNVDFYWEDFECFLQILNNKVNLDVNRIYLHSNCGNSSFAMAMALKHPDKWACCMMSTGYNSLKCAGNIFNTQFFYANAHPDIKEHKPKLNFVKKLYHYFGCNDFNYVPVKSIAEAHIVDFTKIKPRTNPEKISFKTDSYQSNKSYWVTIDGCKDDNFFRSIEAKIENDKIYVNTENTDAYKIHLSKAPIKVSSPVEIIENNKSLCLCNEDVFIKTADKYKSAKLIKKPQIAGPIRDAFSQAHIIIYQSENNDPNYAKAVFDLAKKISPYAKCIKDTDFTDNLIDTHNIIFIGRNSENKTISEIIKKLPIEIASDHIVADSKKYQYENIASIMVYPNPLNVSKYFLFFAPTSQIALESMTDVFKEIGLQKDIAVFQSDERKNIKYYMREKFNSLWQYSKNSKSVIFKNNHKKTAKDYQKTVAKIIREHLNANISIVEPVLSSEYIFANDNITLRDLLAAFHDHWIIKIKIKGSLLKKLINKMLAANAYERKTTFAISGVNFNKPESSKGLLITEIKNDSDYTIALSASQIKKPFLGYLLVDYEIVDQCPLIKLLKDHTERSGPIDLGQKCQNIKIF